MRAGSCSNWAVTKTISQPAACTRLSRSRSRLSAHSSDKGPPHVQAGAPGDTGAGRDHDVNVVLGAGQLHTPEVGR